MASHDRRQLVYIPEIAPTTFLLFFEKRLASQEWSVRDYSVPGQVATRYGREFGWLSTEALAKAQYAVPAPVVSAGELDFWRREIQAKNREYLDFLDPERAAANPRLFPVLDYAELLASPKGQKVLELKRLLESPRSLDWLVWNFFHLAAALGVESLGEAEFVLPLREIHYWPAGRPGCEAFFPDSGMELRMSGEGLEVVEPVAGKRWPMSWAELARPWLHRMSADGVAEKVRQEILRRIDPRRSPKAA